MKRFRWGVLLLLFALFLQGTAVSASGPDAPAEECAALTGTVPFPAVSAEAAVLADLSGTVLYAKEAGRPLPMASTTKIMTALVAAEQTEDLDAPVRIPQEAVNVEGSSVYLYAGETLTMRELLYAILLESANDAAAAAAIVTAGSIEAFAEQMNARAEALGLADTHFVNPHGLDDKAHYTTAQELAVIAAEALRNPDLAEIVRTRKKEIPLRDGEGVRLLVNHNRLLRSLEGCIGVKTGYTRRSGRCLVSAVTRDGGTLLCVTLNAPDDWEDHAALYRWGFSRYETVTLSESGEQYAAVPVVGASGTGETVLVPVCSRERAVCTVLKSGQEITKKTELPHFLYAPVAEGETVGTVIFYNHGEELLRLALTAEEEVPARKAPGFFRRLRMYFSKA